MLLDEEDGVRGDPCAIRPDFRMEKANIREGLRRTGEAADIVTGRNTNRTLKTCEVDEFGERTDRRQHGNTWPIRSDPLLDWICLPTSANVTVQTEKINQVILFLSNDHFMGRHFMC